MKLSRSKNLRQSFIAAAIASLAVVSVSAFAQLAAADVAKLGTTLTPMGAEKGANAAGTIPAWDGGITKPIAGFKPKGYYPDPFPSDKILFTINAANADKYKDNLSPGQMMMLKQYPTYKLTIKKPLNVRPKPSFHRVVMVYRAALAAHRFQSQKMATKPFGIINCTTRAIPMRNTGHRPQ
jgi:Protein of unknown function (DUF1329)